MSQHDAYLDRMTTSLHELEAQIKALSDAHGSHDQQVRELEASLAIAKERLQSLRRAGAELTDEMTQSFAMSFERLKTAVGRAAAQLDGRPG